MQKCGWYFKMVFSTNITYRNRIAVKENIGSTKQNIIHRIVHRISNVLKKELPSAHNKFHAEFNQPTEANGQPVRM